MKKIIISINPEWVAKILNGDKIVEIRKTMPKCKLPIECLIYATKSNNYLLDVGLQKGERYYFCWDKKAHHYPFTTYKGEEPFKGLYEQRVVAKFTLNNIGEPYVYDKEFQEKCCLTVSQLAQYSGYQRKQLYAWGIDNLVIFDKPKELSEFGLKRVPQSWRYIEVKECNIDQQ